MDIPIQIAYGHPSVLHQKKEQFSLVGTELLSPQLCNSKE